MLGNKPEISIEKSLETVDMLERIFPYGRTEAFKIYALLSIKASIAHHVTHETGEIFLAGAYNLEDAMKQGQAFVQQKHPNAGPTEWLTPRLVGGMHFEQLVPVAEIVGMIEKLKKELQPLQPSKEAAELDRMTQYACYLFNMANASSFEKGILTGVINRLKPKNELPKDN